MAEAPEVSVTEIIAQNDNEVGSISGTRRERRNDKSQHKRDEQRLQLHVELSR
jgi:hypothetical protein